MAEDQAKDNLPPDDPEQSDPAETVHATSGETIKVTADHSRVVELKTVEDVMEWSYLRYSMSVIIDRALPDVRDGLKPIHRRILYAMERNGWRPGTKFTKSANIVGEVMGKYHPHGDSAIYDAMVRLAQDWVMRAPLVEGQGNFGSMDGDPPAAHRYTEARMSRAGAALLTDLDKETVDFRDNYDGTQKEPVVLPAMLPNLLLNGQVGIAVGMATNIPTHNLGELCDAITYLIDNGADNTTIDDLLKFVKGPDFPTGGIVYAGPAMKQAYLTGRGSVVIRAVTNIEETKRGRSQIIVSEVPYGVNKETLMKKIADLVKEKKIVGIQALRDESARGKVRMVVELKKDACAGKILNQLFKWTSLQTSFHYNMLALIDGIQPRILGLEDILNEYLKHRRLVVRRRTEYELRKAEERAHILAGLKIALDNIDEVIHLIRSSKDYETAKTGLMERFRLSEVQAQAILAMQLRKLTGLDRQAIENELAELLAKIAEYRAILADEQKILDIIKSELAEMKEKLGDARRTKIINHELGKMTDEDVIPEEDAVILLTDENYVKRTSMTDYRRQNRGGKGKRGLTTKESDTVAQLITASTHDFLSFFTNKGRVFRLRAFDVPAASLQAKGTPVVNLLSLQPEEKVTSIIKYSKDEAQSGDGYLFMATTNGTIKKTKAKEYENIRANGLIAIKLDDGDELRWVRRTSGNDDVIMSTAFGQAIRFNEQDARSMGRSARGVRGIRLRPGDKVVGVDVVDPSNDKAKLLIMGERGYGKITKASNFPVHKRGGIGIKAAVVTAKTGNIMTVRSLDNDTKEIIVISAGGQTIRLAISDISVLGRATQGVRIMSLGAGDLVASVGLVADDGDSDGDSTDDTSSEANNG
ncbi:DNA gyrase subunit A [Candidatus Nanoperiomorbus periodonticus]|uniref:DNA gyrase subunit A n=1 Tax=Candidatus Nanoperiomorbus periodonticus TaxID=2171989 RepID=UPI00101D8A41|nr:DNA gyrase subunit A [Candidatus Nanoperiomorbus periodonticus]RYC75388.1 DNA gyrase subunit A [Candidatus Nanoperiomorbus periodonticus]